MKRVIAAFVLLLYTASIAGIGLKAFYCCDKLQSVSPTFLSDEKQGCAKGGDQTGCCKTKYTFFKIRDTHDVSAAVKSPRQPLMTIDLIFPIHSTASLVMRNIPVACCGNAPPADTGIAGYVLHCVYRI